ncbi:MAG: FAD-dependent oxidoreductase [Alphaproteobacteria bacterium]|nr:FAD-dependent oxidoreductase [Alphaproteobacteria bacterium]
MTGLTLRFGLDFSDLYARAGLAKLDAAFVAWLAARDVALHNRLVTARANPDALEAKGESLLFTDLAPALEDFIAELFGIEQEVQALSAAHHALNPLYACKRLFVQRRAAKAHKPEETESFDGASLRKELAALFGESFSEESYARHVTQWMEQGEAQEASLALAARYACWALYSVEGIKLHAPGVLFKQPRKLDTAHLVPVETVVKDGVTLLRVPHLRRREGFALTDDGASLTHALDDANYCIFCHNQGKDSCSKGLRDKKTNAYQVNSLKITQAGCPLEEHISEMNLLKSQGYGVGALAAVTLSNPMAAGTGHRICNDCMKSCIYQKQEPVNIPQVETRTLKDVLNLPWGFEIYSLLTRWNPLNLRRPLPKPESGYKVLVAGMGPSGYTLAHHLMNDGHTVVGIDGLKIEPLPQEISGVTALGARVPFAPVRDVNALYESLDDRTLAGFGGVAEYGITVRWNKNFLKLIRLLLERRSEFALLGGVRMGGTLTIDDAFAMGFDHVALAMGAGRPTLIDIPNGVARGVRTASDFLMALQLTGAAKKDSIANLQLRLPVVVIGGGLTAVDTATESLAYYPVQVEKFLARYEALVKAKGEQAVRAAWNKEEAEVGDEFLAHGRAIRTERTLAAQEKREPCIWELLDSWGGVRLVYRNTLVNAPSYRLNHEEVEKAFEEGIYFGEEMTPKRVEVDELNRAKAITFSKGESEVTLAARSILVAAGTNPNTVIAREIEGIALDGYYFRAVDEEGHPVTPEKISKPNDVRVLMDVRADGRAISFFGDLHPSFAGNVVKAMGSAKQGYPVVSRVLQKRAPGTAKQPEFLARINTDLRPTVHAVNRLTPTIIEVVLKAPQAARNFQPGQFYRLQNYEAFALKSPESGVQSPDSELRDSGHSTLATTLAMEGLALTGAWVDKAQGLLSTIVLEMGGSSDLCAHLAVGEPVILMGPTGTPTETPGGETVLLAGGGLGNAVLFSIGKALREAGSKVLYFAGYKKAQDRYKVEEIEAAADIVVWCCDEASDFTPSRPQDRYVQGNIIEALLAYHKEQGALRLEDVDRILAIGSDRMMQAVASARHAALKGILKPKHIAIGSINSPMQCMMKEICAQCLQKQVDPETGKETYVYSCFNQDQELDRVSFPHLADRLRQNGVQEKLTAQWVDHCLRAVGRRG